MTEDKIISWNVRSLFTLRNPSKKASLLKLMESVDPFIVCLQDVGKLAQYNIFQGYQKPVVSENWEKNRNVMTIFKEGVNYSLIQNISKPYGAWQTFKIHKGANDSTDLYLTNIYLAGDLKTEDFIEIQNHFEEYRYEKAIFTGDFNAKTRLWDKHCTMPNRNGFKIIGLINDLDLIVLNNGESTRIAESQGQKNSAIDLTLISASIPTRTAKWEAYSDALGSDHLPQIITLSNKCTKNDFSPSLKLRYKTDKADPEIFKSSFSGDCPELKQLPSDKPNDFDELTNRIINHITEAANKGVPNNKKIIDRINNEKDNKNQKNKKKYPKVNPWFSDDCQKYFDERKYRQHRWEKTHSIEDLIAYKKIQAKFRNACKRAKKNAESKFIDSIDLNSTGKEGWEGFNKLHGKYKNPITVKPLKTDPAKSDNFTNNTLEQANMLGKQYHKISHDSNLSQEFLEKRNVYIASDEGSTLYEHQENTNASYNSPITMKELSNQIQKRKKRSSPGEDNINYWMIRNSPQYVHKAILNLFNLIWSTGNIPQSFKTATVIPIPKKDKDLSSPASYRPIALTSHLGKVLEAIINERLKTHLEVEGHFSPNQSGFRNGKETTEQVMRLEADIRKANDKGMVLCAVFLDVSKAFDTAQHCYILKNLNKYNVKGNMYNYCKDFMTDRKFNVSVGDSISETFTQDNGVPQGSVISPTLFLVSVNEISKVLDFNTPSGQFADDAALWRAFKASNKRNGPKKMSKETNKLIAELEAIGYKVNAEKTQAVLFTKKKKIAEYILTIKGQQVITGPYAKYLGIILDKQLNFKLHLDDRRKKGYKILNLMRKCKQCKGKLSQSTSLKTIYKALLEKTVLYGAEIMHTVDKKALDKTGSLLKQAQRIITGTTRRTQSGCLHALAKDTDIETKLDTAKLNFWARKTTQKDNIAGKIMNNTDYLKNNSKRGKNVGVVKHIDKLLKELNIDRNIVAPFKIKQPPTYDHNIHTDTSLTKKINKQKNTDIFMKQTTLEHISTQYENHLAIFTDGSRTVDNQQHNNAVGIGIFSKENRLKTKTSLRISNNTAIATAELKAIDIAMQTINKRANKECSLRSNAIVICTDSLSAVEAIESNKHNTSRPDLVQNIHYRSHLIKSNHDITIDLLWIPSHVGIYGNEKADSLAKASLEKDTIDLNIGLGNSELKNLIKSRLKIKQNSKWQESESSSVKHMRETVPSLLEVKIPLNKKFEKRNRLLVNAPRFLAKGPVACDFCQTDKTVEHILLHCDKSIGIREEVRHSLYKYGFPLNMKTLLAFNPPREIESQILDYINKIIEDI